MNESALKVIADLYPKYGVDLWKHVQLRRCARDGWQDCSAIFIRIHSDLEYRVKPRTHIVNGIECPAPMSEIPKSRVCYYYIDLDKETRVYHKEFDDDGVDYTRVNLGNCFHTKEDALANFYAHYPHMRPEAE